MPNKAYWNQLEEILEFTQALTGDSSEELKESLKDARERKAKASDRPMEEITLASLASEFVDVFTETCDNYKNAKTQSERDAILDEIREASCDIFGTIEEEMSDAFSYIGHRLADIEEESDSFFEDLDDISHTNPKLQKLRMAKSENESYWIHTMPHLGDHIRVKRLGGLYYHHGIYIGKNKVIHFVPPSGNEIINWSEAIVQEDYLDDFLKDGELEVRQYTDDELLELFSPAEIVKNAQKCLGFRNYNLLFNNCEHFAYSCTTGTKRSSQVKEFFSTIVEIIS